MSGEPINVMIIDDHQLIINGLKSLLEYVEDVFFVGGANSMDEAMAFVANHRVDVALMDINMPGGSGIETTVLLKKLFPSIRILALTMHEDINMITKMIEAGASGYILKRTSMNEVLEAIRVVASDGKYLGRDVQSILMENLGSQNPTQIITSGLLVTLSAREKEILTLIAKEINNEQIALRLFISERTVETHRRNIFTKTKTKTIVGLIKYAIKNGLVEQEDA